MEEKFQVRVDERDLVTRAEIGDIDEANRSFPVSFASEQPVIKYDWSRGVRFYEVLEISDAAIDGSRIAGSSGVPFLNNHSSWGGVENTLGISEGLEIKGKRAKSTVSMSTFEGDPKLDRIWHDIKTKRIRSVSVGYTVQKYEITRAPEGSGKLDTYRAVRWTPMEISATPIPADHSAIMERGHDAEGRPYIPEKTVAVEYEIRSEKPPIPAPEPRIETRNSDPNMEKTAAEIAAETRAAEAEKEAKEAKEKLAKIERDAEVRAIIDQANGIATRNGGSAIIGEAKTTELMGSKATPDEVRKLVLQAWAEQDPGKTATGGPRAGNNVSDIAERMGTAILLRAGAISEKELKPEQVDAAREFRGSSLIRSAEQFLEDQGVKTREMDNTQIAKAALNVDVRSGGGMVTADFPSILGNAINRSLRRQFEMATARWKEFSAQGSATDFRPMNRVSFGDAPRLEKVTTGGEIRRGNLKDEKTSYFIEAYGKIIPLDWRALINDDLSAFSRLPRMIAAEVGQLHTDIIYDMILDNPTMEVDGLPVFDSGHGNIAASGTALDATNLSLAIMAFRNQKSLGTASTAGRFLNLEPTILLVGPELEDAAWRLINGVIVATETDKANRWKNRFNIIVEPRIQDKAWYLSCEPGRIDGIEYSFLNGREFWTDMERDFNTSGWAWKVESAFGATFLEYRGWYFNEGV